MEKENKDYLKLIELKQQYPDLTFDNNGYEYLSKEIQDNHREQIKEITEILERKVLGFIRFNNFKPRKNTFDIRVQYNWGLKTVLLNL